MSHNTWIHRIARVTIVKPLVSSRVTPNQLTTARLATGIAAAAAVGSGVDLWRDVGAAIFVLSVLLDRAAGDLARLTGRTSPSGHRYDMIAGPIMTTLEYITGQVIRTPEEWRRWWNKNKKADWDAEDD